MEDRLHHRMNESESLAAVQQPIPLEATRVWRTYLGGALIDAWRGSESPSDGHFPEEWVASVVAARNPGRESVTGEGLSRVSGQLPGTAQAPSEAVALADLIERHPAACLGEAHVESFGTSPGLLVKLLDAAERLAIQVHPDRETAGRLFGSPYGKTEAWFFLGGRAIGGELPYVLCGFKPGMTRQRWEAMFREQDIAGMTASLHRIYPEPGDVLLIRGGMPHAIGPGNWMIEIQEPTDYTIRTERTTPSGYALADAAVHQGLGEEAMFDCFHYETGSFEQLLEACKLQSTILSRREGWVETERIGYADTAYFRLTEWEVRPGHCTRDIASGSRFSVLIVLAGTGTIRWEQNGALSERAVGQGDQLFMPAALARYAFVCSGEDGLRIAQCHPAAIEEEGEERR